MSGEQREPKRRIGFEARRVLIVEAALGVFAEHGFQAASLDEIARRAGVTKPVLYDHFKSKRALYVALLERERDALLAHIDARPREGSAAERVAGAADAIFEFAELHPFAWLMLFRETAGDPEVVELHRQVQRDASARLTQALLEGSDPGYPGAELMQEAAAELLSGAIRSLARWWYDHREVPREQVVTLVMDVFWQGLDRFQSGRRWRAPARRRTPAG